MGVTENFRDYLSANKFVVYTDNNPLTHILASATLEATGQRWVSALGEFNVHIVYRPGSKTLMQISCLDTLMRRKMKVKELRVNL